MGYVSFREGIFEPPKHTPKKFNLRQQVWLDVERAGESEKLHRSKWSEQSTSAQHVRVWKIKLSDIEIHVYLFRLSHVCEMDVQQHDGNFAAFPFVGCQTF